VGSSWRDALNHQGSLAGPLDDTLAAWEADLIAKNSAEEAEEHVTEKCRWAEADGSYMITYNTHTVQEMQPGMYDMAATQQGIVFSSVTTRSDELLTFPGTDQEQIIEDITTFWASEAKFRKHDLPYKRGILLYGPPGSGKSSTVRLVCRDVIARGGIVFQFTNPDLFVSGYRVFRQVQPETPIVVIMEDLDTILDRSNESRILNLLDGAESADQVVFLATTNYPERLGPRIMNRPSRFDRVYRVPHPGLQARELYLENIAGGADIDVKGWAKQTGGLSLAHLKELFIGVEIMGGDEKQTIKVLRGMREKHSSAEDDQIDGEDSVDQIGAYI
jgi:Cdc6-like AAA superfamily ATPase